jgi:hypothetical protein
VPADELGAAARYRAERSRGHTEAIHRLEGVAEIVTLPHIATADLNSDDVIGLADIARGVTPSAKGRRRKS